MLAATAKLDFPNKNKHKTTTKAFLQTERMGNKAISIEISKQRSSILILGRATTEISKYSGVLKDIKFLTVL